MLSEGEKMLPNRNKEGVFPEKVRFKALAAVCQERRRREGNTSKRKSCSRRLRV